MSSYPDTTEASSSSVALYLRSFLCPTIIALLALCGAPLSAQEAVEQLEQEQVEGGEELTFDWQPGPLHAELGTIAEIDVPEGFLFLDGENSRAFMQAIGNLTDGSERGAIFPASNEESWFVIFEWSEVGYVKDDEKDELDADELLASLREGQKAANEERQKMGLTTMEVVGWEQPPSYDAATQNLEWCLSLTSEGEPVLNCNTRLLGRHGVMSATLVASPEELARVLPISKSLLADYAFQDGQRYAQFSQGDKIAEYGLKGLLLGGAAAAALKFGLLQKFWKVLVLLVVAAGAFLRRIFSRLSGRQSATVEGPPQQ